tara:strand:+ start:344 stop:526 length:183 start_codon:yes stop_codon:yes gene_type:complete
MLTYIALEMLLVPLFPKGSDVDTFYWPIATMTRYFSISHSEEGEEEEQNLEKLFRYSLTI